MIGTLVSIWNQISTHPFIVLELLLVPLLLIGRKALPSKDLLIEGGKYARPFPALEKEPDSGPILFKHWDEDTKRQLRRALHWDFLFIPFYVFFGFIACLTASRQLCGNEILRLAFLLTMPAAGLFDIVENVILLQVIKEKATAVWVRIARVSTFFKFALIGVGSTYMLVGLLSYLCVRFLRH